MSKIHLEERQGGSLSPRTLVTIVQRSEAKLGQACKASRTYYLTAKRSVPGQALSLAYVHKGTAERSGA
jgi:hypothetical protein